MRCVLIGMVCAAASRVDAQPERESGILDASVKHDAAFPSRLHPRHAWRHGLAAAQHRSAGPVGHAAACSAGVEAVAVGDWAADGHARGNLMHLRMY